MGQIRSRDLVRKDKKLIKFTKPNKLPYWIFGLPESSNEKPLVVACNCHLVLTRFSELLGYSLQQNNFFGIFASGIKE